MSREEIQKLLGGYATGTLTPAEQQALFAAALEDQNLFNELAREQPLRELLNDPAARAHLLAALDAPAPEHWYVRFWRPLSAVAVAALLATVVIVVARRHGPVPVVQVSRVEKPAAGPAAPAAASPAVIPPAARAVRRPAMTQPAIPKPKQPAAVELARAVTPLPAPLPAAPPPVSAPKNDAEVAAGAKVEGAAAAAVRATAASTTVPASANAPLTPLPELAARTALRAQLIAGAAGAAAPLGSLNGSPPTATALFYGEPPAAGRGGGGGRGGRGGSAGVASGTIDGMLAPARKAEAAPATTAPAAPAGHLGIRYRILQRVASGEFAEINAGAAETVAPGAEFKIETTPNDNGYLRILRETPDGSWREILAHTVERMKPVETGAIAADQPGPMRFAITFSRQPLAATTEAPRASDDLAIDRAPVVIVANRDAAAPQLSVVVTINVR